MSEITKEECDRAAATVTKAVASIVLEDPFYGFLLLKLNIVQDNTPHNPCGTAYVDGKNLGYNAKFINSLTLPQVKGLFKHEVMHVANCHHLRMQTRDHKKWNDATDYVINAIGEEAGWDLPPGGLMDSQYKDYSAEHVYQLLPDPPEGDDGQSSSNFGAVLPHPDGNSESERNLLEQEVVASVLEAANEAKVRGKLPAALERFVEKIRECRLPWRELLARFFKATAKNDYSLMRPNRRYLANGIYMPSLYSTNCGPVVIAIDTSGSITNDELQSALEELNGVIKQARPESVTLVYCDAAVQRVEKYHEHSDIRSTKPKGGGGTAFEPVFNWIKEQRMNPECLIYITDMYGSFPEKAPHYQTLWISTSGVNEAPFGKVLQLNPY